MDSLMQTVFICEKFGWTYEEYQEQPAFFIQAIKEKERMDQVAQRMASKKHRG